MADPDAATPEESRWPAQGMRQRIGSRIERHVLRSAVDMLDERGTELDKIERELVQRESDLAERLERVGAEEAQLEHREQRLAAIGAQDLDATGKIDQLIRVLDETESATAAFRVKAEGMVHAAVEMARELAVR
jgi:hypothetical protein